MTHGEFDVCLTAHMKVGVEGGRGRAGGAEVGIFREEGTKSESTVIKNIMLRVIILRVLSDPFNGSIMLTVHYAKNFNFPTLSNNATLTN